MIMVHNEGITQSDNDIWGNFLQNINTTLVNENGEYN